jgi:hypothetical protein
MNVTPIKLLLIKYRAGESGIMLVTISTIKKISPSKRITGIAIK